MRLKRRTLECGAKCSCALFPEFFKQMWSCESLSWWSQGVGGDKKPGKTDKENFESHYSFPSCETNHLSKLPRKRKTFQGQREKFCFKMSNQIIRVSPLEICSGWVTAAFCSLLLSKDEWRRFVLGDSWRFHFAFSIFKKYLQIKRKRSTLTEPHQDRSSLCCLSKGDINATY